MNERKRYRGRKGLRRLWAKMQRPCCESADPNYVAPSVWAAVVILIIAMGTASFCVGICIGEARERIECNALSGANDLARFTRGKSIELKEDSENACILGEIGAVLVP